MSAADEAAARIAWENPTRVDERSTVAKIADQLTAMDGLDRDDRYTQMMRVTKLAEEVGEAAQALIAYHDVNPRKSGGSVLHVIKELCDVALSAKVALESFGFDAEVQLGHRERAVLARLRAKADDAPTCPDCDGTGSITDPRQVEAFQRSGSNPEFAPEAIECPRCSA